LWKNKKLPDGWAEIEFKKIVKKIPLTGKKLKQKEYLEKGKVLVIDQGQDFVGGYTNKIELKLDCNLPVIVFGDHTKTVKFVNQEFVAGADGVVVLEPMGSLIPKLTYYFIQAIPLPNKGYARHYQYLDKSIIKIPPLNEQKRIVEKIEELLQKLDESKQILEKTEIKMIRFRNSILNYVFEGKLTKKPNDIQQSWNKFPLYQLLKEPLRNGRSGLPTKSNKGIPVLKLTAVTVNDFSDSMEEF